MSDIVERLRQGWRIELSDEELCEAADEIERLREALERLAELDGLVCGKPMLGQEVINYTQFVARAALEGKQ